MPRFTPPLPEGQLKFIAIAPKITSSLSIIGVTYIIWHVLSCAKRRSRVYHRILLSMSVQDLIFSIRCFCSTWVIPAEVGHVWGNVGNTKTCTAAGFFGQAGAVSSALYNGALALYFLLTVTYGWTQSQLKNSKLEIWMHAVPLAIGWFTAVAALPLDLYNSIGWNCWISVHPPGCDGTAEKPCTRGDPDRLLAYRWAFFLSEVWSVFIFTAIVLFRIYRSIVGRESGARRFSIARYSNKKKRLLSQRFAVQAALYVGAYFLAYIFPLVMFHMMTRTGKMHSLLLILLVIFLPLQGFFDALIYARPRYLNYREKRRSSRESESASAFAHRWQSILNALSLCEEGDDNEDDLCDDANEADTEQSRIFYSNGEHPAPPNSGVPIDLKIQKHEILLEKHETAPTILPGTQSNEN